MQTPLSNLWISFSADLQIRRTSARPTSRRVCCCHLLLLVVLLFCGQHPDDLSWLMDIRVFLHLLIYLGITGPLLHAEHPAVMRPGPWGQGMCSHKYRHTGPTKPAPVFFSLLYKRQNSLNKGKQITPQVGMFITQVAWGHHQPEGNIYIYVSTQEMGLHKSTLINNLKKKKFCVFLLIFRHSKGFWESFFWIGPWAKLRGTSCGASGTPSEFGWFSVTAENETNRSVCLLALIWSRVDTGRLHPAPLYR